MEEQQLNTILMQAYTQAPPYIQNYLATGKFDAFMKNITEHYGLHADVAGKIENEILMTIIGLTAPTELPENLKNEARVAPGLISPILEELNTDVFVPLRESLRNAETAVAEPVETSSPVPEKKEEWVQVSPVAQATVVPPPAPPVVPQPIPVPQTPVYTAPAPQPVAEVVPEQPAPAYHEMMSMMRTMSKDIEALKGGTAPTMQPWKPVTVPTEPVATPQTVQAPATSISSTPIPAAPTAPSFPTPPREPEHIVMPTKTTGGDPYREPVE